MTTRFLDSVCFVLPFYDECVRVSCPASRGAMRGGVNFPIPSPLFGLRACSSAHKASSTAHQSPSVSFAYDPERDRKSPDAGRSRVFSSLCALPRTSWVERSATVVSCTLGSSGCAPLPNTSEPLATATWRLAMSRCSATIAL